MTNRRLLIGLAVVALAALVAVGLAEGGGSSPNADATGLSVAQMQARLSGSPAPLAALHAEANKLLDANLATVRSRIAALHGEPLVVSKWASWCIPCKADMPLFQRASLSLGREVAFVGIDSNDAATSGPLEALRKVPLPFPSYYDPSGQIGTAITGSAFTPVTVFRNRRGSVYIRQGGFPSLAKLEAEIRRYALTG